MESIIILQQAQPVLATQTLYLYYYQDRTNSQYFSTHLESPSHQYRLGVELVVVQPSERGLFISVSDRVMFADKK